MVFFLTLSISLFLCNKTIASYAMKKFHSIILTCFWVCFNLRRITCQSMKQMNLQLFEINTIHKSVFGLYFHYKCTHRVQMSLSCQMTHDKLSKSNQPFTYIRTRILPYNHTTMQSYTHINTHAKPFNTYPA